MENTNKLIELKGISVSFDGDKILDDLNLSIAHGEFVTFLGASGCGKTTIINLLMRFYDVTKGEIKVDGMKINDITRESLRKNKLWDLLSQDRFDD